MITLPRPTREVVPRPTREVVPRHTPASGQVLLCGLFGALLRASILSAAGLRVWAAPGRRTGNVLVGRHLSFR